MSHCFSILDAASPSDRERWLGIFHRLPERPPFAHPAYLELFAGAEESAVCATYERGDAVILYPFIVRPLTVLPWTEEASGCDLTSPYGYGGAFAAGASVHDARLFWEEVDRYAREAEAVCSFVRLLPFPDQIAGFPGEVVFRQPNVVRRLGGDEPTVLASYAHKGRKNVKRARSHGLQVECDPTGRRLDEFLAVYDSTMTRTAASGFFSFGRPFFEQLIQRMPSLHTFFHVLHGSEVVATELILHSSTTLFSFLGGTREDAFPMRPNDLLKHEIILWGGGNGYRTFLLGGGLTAGDGIFRYKRSFAPRGEVRFCTGHWIHDRERYEELVADRGLWEAERGRRWDPPSGFFPGYRG